MALIIVKAYLNHGRWLADCPQCGGAEIVRMDRKFKCLGKIPAGFHGDTTDCNFEADVAWPAEKLEIENVLVKRKLSINRNWSVGETVAKLKNENKNHGIV